MEGQNERKRKQPGNNTKAKISEDVDMELTGDDSSQNTSQQRKIFKTK
jgi:hypothetical protein